MPADLEIDMAKIVQDSDANLLRKVRDQFVANHPAQNTTRQVYYGAFLSQLANRIEKDQERMARLSAGFKDIARRAKAGELDTPNAGRQAAASGNDQRKDKCR